MLDRGIQQIIYVNGAYKGKEDTELRWLIHDLLCTDPNDMHFPELAERVRYHKEDSEGVKAMCKIMEDIKNEGRESMLTDMVVSLLKRGKSPAFIADTLEIAKEKVMSIAEANNIAIV